MAVDPPTEPGGVHAEQRLAGRAEGVGQVQLGHHHALEEVGGLADDDGVDVGPASSRRRRARGRRPRARARPSRRRRGWPGASSARCRRRRRVSLPISPPLPGRETRFCCRHGPDVAWATPRVASPSMIRWATSPMRVRPATIIGLAASAPPDGLTLRVVAEPERVAQDQLLGAERGVQLGDVDRSAADAGLLGRRARWTAEVGEVADAEGHRLDAVVDAADPRRALAELAGLVAGGEDRPRTAPSVIGGQSCLRSGSTSSGVGEELVDRAGPTPAGRSGCRAALRRLRAATSAKSASVALPDVEQRPGLEGGEADGVGPQRGDVVRVELAGQHLVDRARATTCRSSRRARCRARRAGASPRPRRAPRRRPSRRGSPGSAATGRRRRASTRS